MIDTNQIHAVVQNAAAVKSTIAPYWPAICGFALWLHLAAKHIFNWLFETAEYFQAHGGLFKFIGKTFWNREVKP